MFQQPYQQQYLPLQPLPQPQPPQYMHTQAPHPEAAGAHQPQQPSPYQPLPPQPPLNFVPLPPQPPLYYQPPPQQQHLPPQQQQYDAPVSFALDPQLQAQVQQYSQVMQLQQYGGGSGGSDPNAHPAPPSYMLPYAYDGSAAPDAGDAYGTVSYGAGGYDAGASAGGGFGGEFGSADARSGGIRAHAAGDK
jgi:hypothetical protein